MSRREETKKLDPSFWLSIFFCTVIAAAVVTAAEWSWDTRLFPWVVGIPALALALWQLLADFRGAQSRIDSEEAPAPGLADAPVDETLPQAIRFRRTLRAMGWILGFVFGIWLLGFLVAIPLFVLLYLKMEAGAGTSVAIILALVTELFIWAVFDALMHLAWPQAALWEMLGW